MKQLYICDLAFEESVWLLCWISNRRVLKNVIFLDIYDSTGSLQAVASKEQCQNFQELSKITCESAVELFGKLNSQGDFVIETYKILAPATLVLSPSPNKNGFHILDKKYERQIIEHPTFYIRNHQLKTLYYIKAIFKRELQDYLWNQKFIEFEAPTLTKQTLYDDSGAIWLDINQQNISLSRCATFHLEPAVVAYEKVFTITNSHANEKAKTNRHLIEYLHLKAELCWANLDELISFAAKMYYEVANNTYIKCKKEFSLFISEEKIQKKLNALAPENHKTITYDEASNILKSKGIDFEYGKSLTSKHEEILTSHFNNCFLWIKYIPYTVEGFMFKRKADNCYLTMTCDLIAPNGFGEILGCAEKITDYDELIQSMKEKGKWKDYHRYQDYALLHQYGLPPHGGIGMGIERALRFLLDINHVKYLKPFAVIKETQINH